MADNALFVQALVNLRNRRAIITVVIELLFGTTYQYVCAYRLGSLQLRSLTAHF